MVFANELRIGNYMAHIDRPNFSFQVNGDSINNFWKGNIDLVGLPLNEEWFRYLGFKPFSKDWVKDGIIVHTRKRGYVINKKVPQMEYVHQLQNYFYANTGKEL